ncbi:MAG: hypothetical protein HKM93_10465, partial [Desulfobacteraceae bacterium]|nr:hypothetical protein [Desulfobacteraceae bacterium]
VDTVEIFVEVIRKSRSGKAIYCTDGVHSFWLPLSVIEVTDYPNGNAGIVMPVWLAREKEVI